MMKWLLVLPSVSAEIRTRVVTGRDVRAGVKLQ